VRVSSLSLFLHRERARVSALSLFQHRERARVSALTQRYRSVAVKKVRGSYSLALLTHKKCEKTHSLTLSGTWKGEGRQMIKLKWKFTPYNSKFDRPGLPDFTVNPWAKFCSRFRSQKHKGTWGTKIQRFKTKTQNLSYSIPSGVASFCCRKYFCGQI